MLEALAPLIDGSGLGSGSRSRARRVLELASYPYEHIRGYARAWPGVAFAGTVRDEREQT